MHAWYIKSQQGTQKSSAAEFLILSANFMWFGVFYKDEHLGTNFQTFLKESYPDSLGSCKPH